MVFGLKAIGSVFGGGAIASSRQQQRATNPWGNSMGLKPEVGDPAEHYQHLLGEFERKYSALIDPPADIDAEVLAGMEYEDALGKARAANVREFRQYTRADLDRGIAEYGNILSEQTHAETQAAAIQQQNVKYIQGNVQRGLDAARTEAALGGYLAGIRQSVNKTQSYITFN